MNSSNPSYESMDCVIKWGILLNLLEIFSFVSKYLSCNTEKTAEMRWKRMSGAE